MKKAIVLVLIIGLVIGAPLLSKLTNKSSAKELNAETAELRVIRSSVLASGSLVYRDQVELRSEVIGKVSEVNVIEGQAVNADDVILRIDPEQFVTQVDQQEANVRIQRIGIQRQDLLISNLQRQFKRKNDLFDRGLLDSDAFESAANELDIAKIDLRSRREALSQAQAQLAQAQDRLDRTVVRSPIDGIVTAVNVKVGETVIAGTTNIQGSVMVSVANPAEVLAEINVDEADIARVAAGQDCDIFAVAFPDQPLQGKVESIGTSARASVGGRGLNFLVKVLIDNQQLNVRPGMSARAEIYTASAEDSLAIPVQAVLYEEPDADAPDDAEERPYLFLFDDGQAQQRFVKLGLADDSYQAITEGLADNDQVLTGPYRVLRFLKDGEDVELIEADGQSGDKANNGDDE